MGRDAPSTATLDAARAHARAQEDAAAADRTPGDPSLLAATEVPGGGYATLRLPRDAVLRCTDTTGDTCVALVVHRAAHPAERLNVADTVKVQWQAYPGAGTQLLSGLGRVLMTVVDDGGAGMDALCGCTNARSESARRGGAPTGPWSATPNARELLLLGLARWGLDRRDLPPPLDLFRSVRVAPDGALELQPPGPAGATVALRAEVDVIVTMAVVPHPLDDRDRYVAGPVAVEARTERRPDPDPWRATTPERRRASENTEASLAGGLA